ncbi:hypothetical protein RHGRI_037274 [Rhododendron griersonianum]|uniref:Uncharacterized protein n=1 Tax=Rhododendron griersonianum TaxID=479676 RepID=A0AAV6HUV1_9ERIC|nr:hypothetical protein RHGRI_037274 [Rhododendron griersonianum]
MEPPHPRRNCTNVAAPPMPPPLTHRHPPPPQTTPMSMKPVPVRPPPLPPSNRLLLETGFRELSPLT